MKDFVIQDTKRPNWRLSDSKKLSNDGICTLDQWIQGGSKLMSFTYYEGKTSETAEKTTVTAPSVTNLTANTCKITSSFSSTEQVVECGTVISMDGSDYELFGADRNSSKGTSFWYTTEKHYHPLYSNKKYYIKRISIFSNYYL